MSLLSVYAYLEGELLHGRRCPTVREIQQAVGAGSTREVKQQLDILIEKGYIIRTHDKSRNLRLGRLPTENEIKRLSGQVTEKDTKETMWTPW